MAIPCGMHSWSHGSLNIDDTKTDETGTFHSVKQRETKLYLIFEALLTVVRLSSSRHGWD